MLINLRVGVENNNDNIEEDIGYETNAVIDDVLNASNQNYIDVDELLNLSIEEMPPARKRRKTVNVADTECSLCDFKAETNETLATHMAHIHQDGNSTRNIQVVSSNRVYSTHLCKANEYPIFKPLFLFMR